MTWREFKARVEAMGVRDDDVIGYVDTIGEPEEVMFKTIELRDKPPYFDWLSDEQAAAYPGQREVNIT